MAQDTAHAKHSATTNSNGTAILVPSYISPLAKLISHTHAERTITAIKIPLPGYPTFALICLYKTYHAALTRKMERILDSL